jgi:hypothetical protein
MFRLSPAALTTSRFDVPRVGSNGEMIWVASLETTTSLRLSARSFWSLTSRIFPASARPSPRDPPIVPSAV